MIGTLVLLVAFPALTAATSTAEVLATLVLDPAQLEFGQYEGYDLVTIDGAVHTTEPARPMLPVFYIQLLLPPGSDCSDIATSLAGTVELPGVYDILPAPRPVIFSSDQEAEVPQPNARTHHTDRPYPAEIVRLAGVGSFGGHRIATVAVAPLQYEPAKGRLTLHTSIEISLATETTDDEGARLLQEPAPSRAVTEVVGKFVVNADELSNPSPRMSVGSRGDDLDYLVVCPEELAAEFQRLADWKTLKGVRAELVTLEDIATNPFYSGADEAERIRECIKDFRNTRGIAWVLLGGDTSLVPARLAHDFFYDQGIPCDLYYADLDGSWNDDGDDRWGELTEDGVDMYSDVFVGRAPVCDETGATAFVDKVLAYEGAPFDVRDDFQLDMLFLGEIMWNTPDPYTDGGVALDMIEDASVPPRFAPITKLYQRDYNLFSANAVVHLNGGYNIVMHEGHANIGKVCTGPDEMTIEQLDGLTNGAGGGLWYSVGCWSAAIDHDTFGEHWITNPDGGGVAYVGNSRYGWGCPGYPGQCVSDLYSQEFFESLFGRDLVNAGVAHADAKHQFVGLAASDDYMRYAMYELNLLGDPETPIWTDVPRSLTVLHAETVELSEGVGSLSVSVTDAGSPVAGARVCVASSDLSVYEVAETSASGTAVVAFEDAGASDVTVTVTAKNFVPHGSSVAVESSQTGVDGDAAPARVTGLRQNYPNPFNPATSIAFSLKDGAHVNIAVYDVAGRRVALLVDDEIEAGVSSVRWDGRDASGRAVASGTYFARMVAGGELFETKMTLLK